MARDDPITVQQCDYCGELFNTSEHHPRRYCSIACEEGRGRLPNDDPESPQFWRYGRENPTAITGYTVVATGLCRTCYTPDWHKKPTDYERDVVSHNEETETIVVETHVMLGTIEQYDPHNDVFLLEETLTQPDGNMIIRRRRIPRTALARQLRSGDWWCHE